MPVFLITYKSHIEMGYGIFITIPIIMIIGIVVFL